MLHLTFHVFALTSSLPAAARLGTAFGATLAGTEPSALYSACQVCWSLVTYSYSYTKYGTHVMATPDDTVVWGCGGFGEAAQ